VDADVLVVGGGCAGVAAAVAAARGGARVVLVERYGFLGGQATSALVGTICGLFLRGPTPVWAVGGLPRALAERLQAASGTAVTGWTDGLHFLPYETLALRRLCDEVLAAHGVEVRSHASVTGLRRGAGWEAELWWWDRSARLDAAMVVDTSGVAAAARLAGVATLPAEPRQAGALGAVVDGMPAGDLSAVRLGLVRDLLRGVADGRLPAEARGVGLVPGTQRGRRALWKVAVPEPLDDDPAGLGRVEARARGLLSDVVGYLRGLPAWAGLEVVEVAAQLGVRTGPRPRGRAVLAGAEVLAAARPADGVAVGAWPVERWGAGPRPELTLLPEGATYTVPVGCLRAPDEALFFGGRCVSADEVAIGSARVIGTAMGTGYAAGTLAAALLAGGSEAAGVARARQELEIGEGG
jgi:hypothetical protein